MMKNRPFILFIAALLLITSPLAASEDGEEVKELDPILEKRGIDDRGEITLDLVRASQETAARIDSDLGLGGTLVLERLFEVPRSDNFLRLSGHYRLSPKHRLNFQYADVSREGTRTLFEEEVEIGGTIFPISAEVGARDKTQFAAAEYRYAFVNNGRAEAGLGAGLALMDLDVTLFGSVGAGQGLELTASESVGATVVLPVVGVYTEFTLKRRLLLSIEGLLFSFALSDSEGNISDSRVALRWYPSKIFGFGVALNRTRIDVDLERGNDTIRLNYVLDGPSVFVTFAIPGARCRR
jgi:hypothetical protein